MLTPYQQGLLSDLRAPFSYGMPLIGWKDAQVIFRGDGALPAIGALEPNHWSCFIQNTYFLLRVKRPVSVYRGYETAAVKAPYGVDHPSYYLNLVKNRNPATPDGRWWSPARPTLAIDNVGASSGERSSVRAGSAITKEWNRLDYWIEAELPVSAFVYVGRASAQQDKLAYGGTKYGGGDYQFRLREEPETVFRWMKRYAAPVSTRESDPCRAVEDGEGAPVTSGRWTS